MPVCWRGIFCLSLLAGAVFLSSFFMFVPSELMLPPTYENTVKLARQNHAIVSRRADLQLVKTSHKGEGIMKRVHVAKGSVNHLLHLSEAEFQPGTEVER